MITEIKTMTLHEIKKVAANTWALIADPVYSEKYGKLKSCMRILRSFPCRYKRLDGGSGIQTHPLAIPYFLLQRFFRRH